MSSEVKVNTNQIPLKRADYSTNQEVRWCPGCGDYAILATMQKVMAELQLPRENTVIVSGIGCAGRFPYYMNTYGFHTIHGRAPAIASGLKVSRPELDVWVVTGDGDALSIGTNHLVHCLRRNVGVKILLLNNQIYGLTKGQYSPTSGQGKVSVTTPSGSYENPVDPVSLALSAGATFVARAIDVDAPGLSTVLKRAVAHKGTAFVEILQNCNIFNDGFFKDIRERSSRLDNSIVVAHGEPLIFGADRDKALKLDGLKLIVTDNIDDALVYDAMSEDPIMAQILNKSRAPLPLGVLREIQKPSLEEQIAKSKAAANKPDFQTLLQSGHCWQL